MNTPQEPTKPRNIVICSDGTGNTANKNRGTNVFKLFEATDLALPPQGSSSPLQIAIYDDGVGTETFKPLRLLGGAFGWGLSRNVRQLYTSLVRNYRPGDKIFLFGFSRGAFTVRSLGGFVTACGILKWEQFSSDADLLAAVKDAYGVYRKRYMTGARQRLRALHRKMRGGRPPSSPFEARAEKFRSKYAIHDSRRIAFIGCWDTVDAVGLPFDHLAAFINYFIYPFKFADHYLNEHIEQARHALAVDEQRHTFHPLMWDSRSEVDHERIKQVWFAGVHSNVGGGYPKQGLSLVTLDWMTTEAQAAGLRLVPADAARISSHANVNDKLYNSRAGLAVYYRYKPRDIYKICEDANTPALLHDSALNRIARRTDGYAPGNLPAGLAVVATGNAPARYAQAGRLIQQAYRGDTSLLDRAKGLVWIRLSSHYVFLGLSALALGIAVHDSVPSGRWLAALSKLFSLDLPTTLLRAFVSDRAFDVLVAGIALFFLLGVWAKGRMRRRFSAFWHVVAGQWPP